MKSIILVPDGAPDEPVLELGGKTPLEAAATPHLDYLAARGVVGRIRTIPEGLASGSDVGNLSILGVDPRGLAPGRAAWEAAGRGVPMGPLDLVFRCNLVSLADPRGGYSGGSLDPGLSLEDHTAGEIAESEASLLMRELNASIGGPRVEFLAGLGYRNLMVVREEKAEALLSAVMAPHQILGQPIGRWLPREPRLLAWMRQAARILADHPINVARRSRGLRPANGIWLWGAGRRQNLPSFESLFGKTGALIAAVDLVRGLGTAMKMELIRVPGATGGLASNLRGKAEAALRALEGKDAVYVHVEAPDEASHQRCVKAKIAAIERFDRDLVGPLLAGLHGLEWRILVVSDHVTKVTTGEHGTEPVPFLWAEESGSPSGPGTRFSEVDARMSGILLEPGTRLIGLFLEGSEGRSIESFRVRAGVCR